MSYGYSSKKSGKGYGTSLGYTSGKRSHTNAEKAIFHGLKAARRWAQNGQYGDAAEIAKAVSECWLKSRNRNMPDEMDLGEDCESHLRHRLGQAKHNVEAGDYTLAAEKAWAVSTAYLAYKKEHDKWDGDGD